MSPGGVVIKTWEGKKNRVKGMRVNSMLQVTYSRDYVNGIHHHRHIIS